MRQWVMLQNEVGFRLCKQPYNSPDIREMIHSLWVLQAYRKKSPNRILLVASYNRYSLRYLLYARSGEGQPQETLPPQSSSPTTHTSPLHERSGEQYVFSTTISAEGRPWAVSNSFSTVSHITPHVHIFGN